ncbi:uncharacterized protein CTHT_0056420 [Thermochaetoides thermophila DSM 1495]|uniref:WIBG Mago-binding domain-containing protein n=1 Tax=Chaetomium thermophilum (strain DSM 1495 / CBS 144.50 / IMI 039719) TaxID=759272 RepID=G0SC95_CHATD|nr:hypothetical protein CTHT_0056420 [Thermochaetoides thermophila DSM 1495]EGS19021.1 hypothetical protein CTHT_0056420 [Thermochaetoides thermophila DSM 1495]
MPPQKLQTSNAGIVTDPKSGERIIPASVRADGSIRKEIRVRDGYIPPEDVAIYKNKRAEDFRNRGRGLPPGAEGLKDEVTKPAQSAAANKNAKRREARRKAKAAAEDGKVAEHNEQSETAAVPSEKTKSEEPPKQPDPEAEKEKKVRSLKKKLKQARELQVKKENGQALLPEQIAKVIKINELIRELKALGIEDVEDSKKSAKEASKTKASEPST